MLERFETFTFSIYEIQRCWNKIASEGMEQFGLKGSYAVYLIAMRRFPEGVTAARLSSLCGRDKADVSRAAAVLESQGLISKETGSGNLYRAKLMLTERGAAVTEEIARKAEYAEKAAGSGLTEDERENLYKSLEIIRQNLRELAKDGIPVEERPELSGLPDIIKLY